mgnify:FL=1
MNKWILLFVFFFTYSMAATVQLKKVDGSTGSLIDGVKNIPLTTNVAEVVGLKITVRSDNENHELNAVADGFGINDLSDTNTNERIRFNGGEKMVLSFDKDIVITQFDFQFFDDGERFFIEHSNGVMEITWDALSHKSSDYINTNLVISANSDISLYVTGGDDIGLQSMDVDVLDNDNLPPLTLTPSNSTLFLSAEVENPSGREFSLNSSHALESNEWTRINTFSTSTNWVITPTASQQFFITSAVD